MGLFDQLGYKVGDIIAGGFKIDKGQYQYSPTTTSTYAPVTTTTTTSTYAPTYAIEKSPQIIIGSPDATIQTKKEQSTTPAVTTSPVIQVTPEVSPSVKGAGFSATQMEGMLPLLLIGAGAFFFLKKNDKKK